MQVIWIVGASSGIGLEMTKRFLDKGYGVVASSRGASESDELASLKSRFAETLCCVDVDVTQAETLPAKLRAAWACFGQPDIWLYNAGVYQPTPYDEAQWDDFALMNQVNYLGCVALMLALRGKLAETSPKPMRWVWNLSISNQVGLPYGGGYSAPKAALLNLAESLQPELQAHDIQLQVINHGFVKTRLTAKNTFEMPALMTPEFAAQTMVDWITANKQGAFELHFPKKLTLPLKWMRFLPYRGLFFLTRKMLK